MPQTLSNVIYTVSYLRYSTDLSISILLDVK